MFVECPNFTGLWGPFFLVKEIIFCLWIYLNKGYPKTDPSPTMVIPCKSSLSVYFILLSLLY